MDADTIKRIYRERQERLAESRKQAQRVRDVLKGRLDTSFRDLVPAGEEPVVANLIKAAGRTLTQRVAKTPRLHAVSRLESPTAKTRAEKHEGKMSERLDRMRFPLMLKQGAYWLINHGFLAGDLTYDSRLGHSRIRFRDPMHTYPDTVWPHDPNVIDCLFAFDLMPHQLTSLYPETRGLVEHHREEKGGTPDVKIAELHTAEARFVALIEPEPVLLTVQKNHLSKPCVWVGRDISIDLDMDGQFDQVIPALIAQAKLMALVMAYAEQQVFSETVVTGDISSNGGQWAQGPGSVNVLRGQGAGAAKLTNNMSVQVFQELDRLERAVRVSGSFPAQLSGEPVSSVATGRGIEQLMQGVDDNVAHYQDILANMLYDIMGTIPDYERSYGVKEPAWARDVTVHPSFATGTDPATTVRLLQLLGSKMLSHSTVMDQLPEVEDTEQEKRRIKVEDLEEALTAQLQQAAAEGSVDPALIIDLKKQMMSGVTFIDAYENYLEKQAAAQQAAMEAMGGGMEGMAPPGGDFESEVQPLESLLGMTSGGSPMSGVRGAQPI
jgi:hypothetical protein